MERKGRERVWFGVSEVVVAGGGEDKEVVRDVGKWKLTEVTIVKKRCLQGR